ncbi:MULTISPECIES: 3-deoxy-D-manno-octulosonic acid kinase [Luteimonas]|uniref:3-deoxy-D-manno-octulosonic acid kinase n=1 Tax=Luteimonas TaxID=83614 RepID=UPI000C7C792B|nr:MULTISPECIES: 3-deoxy-D-manno-octulosonic acid kinase [Luteimonas]
MTRFDPSESLTPIPANGRAGEYGAILFDGTQLRQADPRWFEPERWGDRAQRVDGSGRGGAWFIEASYGDCVLRQYLRGGWVGRFNRDLHLWRGATRVRSFVEFRLLRELLRRDLPVPQPIAASYLRRGLQYKAWILVERLPDVQSLADLIAVSPASAPLEQTGRLIARFHRAGLDHADLNAHNILFDGVGKGWFIDLDRSQLRIPATRWREANLARLKRSLLKLRGARSVEDVEGDFARLRRSYDTLWSRGT